jgi:preprotein translocase subunit SecE
MATDVAVAEGNAVKRAFVGTIEFYHQVIAELKKVTWPDKTQVRQLSIGVIVISLFVGGVIAIIDVVLQQVLVRWIPALFGS